MGTYYAITLVRRPANADAEALHRLARSELDRVEGLMSIYRSDSDVGRINAAGHTDWVPVSSETVSLVEQALAIGRLTGGAYNITAGPLVNLWGFGPCEGDTPPAEPEAPTRADSIDPAHPPPHRDRPGGIPADDEIAAARQHVGLELIEPRPDPPAVRKRDPQARIDLSSIAKGFGVDRAAEALERMGVEDYCLDVGGEIRVRGRNPRGLLWQVAIDSPEASGQSIQRVMALRNRAIATSGDYRIFTEDAGARYSHIIDPRTGYPIDNTIASVTVLDRSCARADAWATALMTLGPEAGFVLAVRERLAALFLLRTSGGIEERRTPGFR